jgi:hypothetical protein
MSVGYCAGKLGHSQVRTVPKTPDFLVFILENRRKTKYALSLPNALERAQSTGRPAIVTYTSLDQALNAIERLEGKVAQIAITSPVSKKHSDYAKSWTSAPIILIDSIRALSPIGKLFDPV